MRPVLGLAAALVLILAALLLPACGTTARRGLTPVSQQQVHTLNTQQPCLSEPEVLPLADLAIVLLAREAAAAGLITYERAAELAASPPPLVCLVATPEPCKVMGVCSLGSDGKQDCRPKAGCAGLGWAWVSRTWPAGVEGSWRAALVDEIANALGDAWGLPLRPEGTGPMPAIRERVIHQLVALGAL